MCSKIILIFYIQVFMVQVLLGQCWTGTKFTPGAFGYVGTNTPAAKFGYDSMADWVVSGFCSTMPPTVKFTPTNGGTLSVTSGSTIPVTGIAVISDNAYEGTLNVAGTLPFIGSSNMEGLVPSVGTGVIKHACGNGLKSLTALSIMSPPASTVTSECTTPRGEPVIVSGLTAPSLAVPNCVTAGFTAPVYVENPYVTPPLPCCEVFLDAPYDVEITATNSVVLPVTSSSAIPPIGLSVSTETAYGGSLLVVGELPFIGVVDVEGLLPTMGAGEVSHTCGNAINTVTTDETANYFSTTEAPAHVFASATSKTPGYGCCAGRAGNNYRYTY